MLEDAKPYPWGPGKVARYRDEDMFLLGVAIDRYVKHKERPTAGLLPFLMSEVFEPIGNTSLPIVRTLELNPQDGFSQGAFGLCATLGDLAKVAALLQNRGKWYGRRKQHEQLVRSQP